EDGDDVLYGGSAGDTIYGGAGNDTIYSDHAHTTQTSYVYGGAGADTFVFSFSHNQRELPWATVIEDFEVGVDKIRIDGMPYNDVFVGGYDTDRSNEFRIFYDAGDDITYVQGNAYRGWFRTHIAVKGDYVNNVDPADNLSVSDFEFVNIITDNDGTDADITANIIRESDDNKHEGLIGSNSGDTIFGSGGDEINAMDGNDVIIFKRGTNPNGNGGIHTGKGNDLVFGVSEYDRMYVNNLGGDNTLIGGNNTGIYMHRENPGNDLVISLGRDMPFGLGNGGNDTMYGGRGGDYNFDGGGDNDFMHAGYGDDIDRFAGGSGDDTLIGGYGGDYIRGGNFSNDNGYGSDTFIIYDPMESTSTQTDVIFDFDTNDDQIILHGFTGIGPGATQVTITQYNATQHGYPGQNWTDITASGGDSDFKLTLKGHHNLTAGTDIIFNSAQLGSDSAETAADFTKTAGSDILFGMSNHDTIEGGAGDDSLYGGHSNDMLYGEADDDYLDGGYGDDTLDGGAGADELMGGYHDDVFVFDATSSTAANTDIIWDFKSAKDGDKIDLSDASFGGIGYGDLTISTPGLDAANSTMYTVITEANTGFTLKLIGYFEDGFNLGASDFIF
ncbi:MAG: hypothetical protein CMM94_05215, partial [Rickettsiales bacterium]|nr:hypothetical protein [Rickettsiales bacterium]